MKRAFLVLIMLVLGACSHRPFRVQDQGQHAYSFAREVERLAGVRSLWPGFDPMAIPLAVYDGERTYLFRHPAPPAGFVPVEHSEFAVHVYEGRYPAVTANTSVDIGGTTSATVVLDSSEGYRSLTDLAAVALHEAFHVYQRERHPSWQANEGDLFMYPTDNARLLALRRLETEALRRALATSDPAESACWAGQALALRRKRFAYMDSVFATYERRTELNEGLATYVELVAVGRETAVLPTGGFDAAQVRRRAYATGAAFALLLDRFRPDWRESFEADDRQNLDAALQAALGADQGNLSGQCNFSDAEVAEAERVAAEDVATLLLRQAEQRAAFDSRPGWRVVVRAADGQPLWPLGFDPLNVESVKGGLLHTRFLRLGNDAGELQAIDEAGVDIEVLTEGIGRHPLFNGVRSATIAGLMKPEIRTEDRHVTIRAPGLTAQFQNARVQVSSTEVLVLLRADR